MASESSEQKKTKQTRKNNISRLTLTRWLVVIFYIHSIGIIVYLIANHSGLTLSIIEWVLLVAFMIALGVMGNLGLLYPKKTNPKTPNIEQNESQNNKPKIDNETRSNIAINLILYLFTLGATVLIITNFTTFKPGTFVWIIIVLVITRAFIGAISYNLTKPKTPEEQEAEISTPKTGWKLAWVRYSTTVLAGIFVFWIVAMGRDFWGELPLQIIFIVGVCAVLYEGVATNNYEKRYSLVAPKPDPRMPRKLHLALIWTGVGMSFGVVGAGWLLSTIIETMLGFELQFSSATDAWVSFVLSVMITAGGTILIVFLIWPLGLELMHKFIFTEEHKREWAYWDFARFEAKEEIKNG